jgi:hypothetical protein
MGLEFAHPEGAKFVMRRLYSRGVWAIFSTLDPHVLQYKPGLLLDPALCAEILEITEAAIGEARDDAAAAPEAATHVFADDPDIPLRDLPSFPADPAARSALTQQLEAWAVSGEPPYPHPSNAR